MKKIILSILLVQLYTFNSAFSEETKQKDHIFKNIFEKYQLKVFYNKSSNYFPKGWKTKEINPQVIEISKKELNRFPKILEIEFSKYSINTIKENLKSIYLAKDIKFFNISYGATYFENSIYLTSNGVENYYTDIYLTHLFHHEFSSILFNKYNFPKDEWFSWKPREFYYGNGGLDALKSKNDSLYGNEELYKVGLLSEYSNASLEEDFNVYSGVIFSEPDRFYRLKEKYPYIKEKFKIWLKFYQSFDSKITEENLFSSIKK